MIRPSRADFLAFDTSLRIPVVADIPADLDTPLSAYWKLTGGAVGSFLLESITGGEQIGRYSVIGFEPVETFETAADFAGDPLAAVFDHLGKLEYLEREGLPKFIGGAVGFVGYDYVRRIERLPDAPADALHIPEVAMMLYDRVVVFDHARNRARAVFLAPPSEHGYEAALGFFASVASRLAGPLAPLPERPSTRFEPSVHTSDEAFHQMVRRLIEAISAGDCIQVVASRRWSQRTDADPVQLYRALRTLNPSPYMFLVNYSWGAVIGASPELLVSVDGGEARVRPIAGTRRRGKSEADDAALEQELLADEKERAEHLMLVDLGRNDLGKISVTGTVGVKDFMVVERYSHVMHIVSDVRGQVRPGCSTLDVIRAVFPAGTLSGAPKVRAMELIDEVETLRRGIYGGAIGMLSPNGDADLAIAIRSILLADGVAHVQAGAGVVFDSDPLRETQETVEKASAPLRAIRLAETGELE